MASIVTGQPDALITVRTGSSRLEAKCLLEFGSRNVLEHVIERARRGGWNPIVCTTVDASDDILADLAERLEVRCFRGSVSDKLERWRQACRTFELVDFHTIDADDPFFDPVLCHASIELLRTGAFDIVYPSETTYLASVGYSLTRDLVDRACALKTTEDTEMMWFHVEKVPGIRAATLEVPDGRARNVRLTLDYPEDYWLLRTVLRVLGPHAGRNDIERLFLSNPELTQVNWFRNEEWRAGQEAKRV